MLIFTPEQLLSTGAVLVHQAAWLPQLVQTRPALELYFGGKRRNSLSTKEQIVWLCETNNFILQFKLFCPKAVFCVKDTLMHGVKHEDLLDIMIFQSLLLTSALAD